MRVCLRVDLQSRQVLRKILSGGAPVLRRSRLEFCVTNDADLAAEGVRASADLATPAFAPSASLSVPQSASANGGLPQNASATAAEGAGVAPAPAPPSLESAPVTAARAAASIDASASSAPPQQQQQPPKSSLLKWFTLVNELVLKRALRLSGVAEIDCYVNDNHLARFQGDGFVLWIARNLFVQSINQSLSSSHALFCCLPFSL
jgi:hypothetical protein